MGESNSVINLMFLCSGLNELNNHSIHPDWHLILDHIPLTVTIPIEEEFIQLSKLSLPKKNEEEEVFVTEVVDIFKSLDTSILSNQESLELVVNLLALRIDQAWNTNARKVNIIQHSKKWWNKDCNRALNKYRVSRNLKDWKLFKRTVKSTKRLFFDTKIQKVTNKDRGP